MTFFKQENMPNSIFLKSCQDVKNRESACVYTQKEGKNSKTIDWIIEIKTANSISVDSIIFQSR